MINFLDSIPAVSLADKKVLLRVDFNVPIKEDKILNDFKIKAHRETIDYFLVNGAKVLLVSHLDATDSFLPIAEEIGHVLGQTMSLVPHSQLNSLDVLWGASPILLLDNIRQDKREEENSEELARELLRGFDLYVNDAFASSHRAHASMSAITKFIPSYAGFLVQKEIKNLSEVLSVSPEGKVIVLGGAKISTKLPVIKNLLDKTEKILIGGAIANNFFKAWGIAVGDSIVDDGVFNDIESDKIILPTDIVVSKNKEDGEVRLLSNIAQREMILDIGPQSAANFEEIIKGASMVVWNGPMGLAEKENFRKGTRTIAKAVAGSPKSIVGGGDTIATVSDMLDKFSFVSTGGGAMLDFLAGKILPGLEALGYYKKND